MIASGFSVAMNWHTIQVCFQRFTLNGLDMRTKKMMKASTSPIILHLREKGYFNVSHNQLYKKSQMSIGKNKIISFQKLAVSLGIAISSTVFSFVGTILLGTIIGFILNPSHEHNYYACACDEAPLLTDIQAVAVGITVFLVLTIGIYFITRKLKFSKREQVIALIIFTLINYGVISTAVEILHTQVSG